MAVWETEDESTGPAPLPTPADTPYRALSRTVSRGSRKSGRSITPPGKKNKSRSPPPLPGDKGSKRSSRDISIDENISILDPRRFTPTLHANLVSEILSLRRDQEEKLKIIESLETSLHTVREESETQQASLLSTGKENRSLKRQLSLLEGGTSSALGELARERDEAIESTAETRKRLDVTQKKLRSQEEDSERVHQQWEKEKDEWEEEKRKYERRVHVAESRLKVVLDEVAAFQAAQANAHNGAESDGEGSVKDDAASVRTMSLTGSVRFSVANSILKATGNSLADELGFDGYEDESDYGGRESVLSNGHMRNFSRDSLAFRTHRRHQSNESLIRPGSVLRGKLAFNSAALERLEDGIIKEDDESQPELPPPAPKVSYVDTGIQYSPPPSPKIIPIKSSTPEPFMQRLERLYDLDSPPRGDHEIEANQRRKRVHPSHPPAIKTLDIHNQMVNGSSQTVEEPPSPPRTPVTPFQERPPIPKSVMASASTQTDDIAPPLQPTFLIPSISIIPPTSRPSSPREPRLPQLTKDFGCQVSMPSTVSMMSSSMQTEEIRVDLRLDKLPLHLHPSAITSRPSSPAVGVADFATEDTRQFTPIPGNLPPRNPRRLASKRSLVEMPSSPPIASFSMRGEDTYDAYPGNNDDGPLSSQRAPMRRPPRISSLFAGFDGNSSDEIDEFADADLSDLEYRTALSAPKPRTGPYRGAKRSSVGTVGSSENAFSPKPISRYFPKPAEDFEAFDASATYPTRDMRDAGFGRRGSRRGGRPSIFGTKASVMRRTALIQSGISSHQGPRSPSLNDPAEPPFPIPTRASSRKPGTSSTAPSEGRTSPSRGSEAWPRRGSNRSHYRANSIRKVRSAAVMPRNQRSRRRGSRSPPPFSPTALVPESPRLPPLPNNDITRPRTRDGYMQSRFKMHGSQPSTTTANTVESAPGSQGGPNQTPTVVDAIAQTMVGEWMFKYVRRRKSFGVADKQGGDDNSNDRHKRWVWLAPYDRSILWSSKQPASGSALLGKSGRKLTIQSVLDVKDDNPPPKGTTQVFNRSILILTPQRALKFTASNAERHYVWLTSLSFLAHSNQAVPDTLVVPPPKPPPKPPIEQYELPKPKRRPIRDSIRLTKAKTAIIKSDPVVPEMPVMESLPPPIPTYRPPPVPEIYHLPAHARDMSRDAAEPPSVPRFLDRPNHPPVHGRKRSNTGGHVPPPLSFRGFSGPAGSGGHHASTNSTAGNSIMTAGSSDIYSNAGASAVTGSSGMTWATPSVRASEASSGPAPPVMNNFFDAIGTVRMEAFISPLGFRGFDETPYEQDDLRAVTRRRSKEVRRRASRSRQRDSYQSRGTRGTEVTDDLDEWYLRDDPFRGF
ncbi:hypothetical protein N0V88_000939 [Collariella sp. IMI 366227]|nr:hypothetical protein N0V88_000939 [Collariella sp. IMI 366227]